MAAVNPMPARDPVGNRRPLGDANGDRVERLATGAPLAGIDWPTVYASGRRGYSDYPTLRHAMA